MKAIAALLIAMHAPLAAAAYKCVDENGRTFFGDVPPAACAKVPIYEMDKSGIVLRKIEPTPTAQQVKERLEAQERRKEAERAAAAQKRRDTALLNSYASASELDVARDRNIEPVNGRIAAARERIKELDKRERQLDDQIEFYRSGKSRRNSKAADPPAWMLGDLDRVRKERSMLREGIVRDGKEIEELRAKYESDKRRWIALKASAGRIDAAPTPAPEPAKVPAGAVRN